MNEIGLRISVVTVVLNSKDLILGTIESVTNQTYDNIEYIVIDGGSTDGTTEIIMRYSEKIHSMIIEPDKGIYDAMNKAIKMASGDFLIFMNAGDTFFSENTIKDFVPKGISQNAIYYGDAIYVDKLSGNDYRRGGPFSKYRLSKTNICHQTIFYPQEVYKSYSYNLKYKMVADWAYNIQLFNKYPYVYLDQIITCYDTTGMSAITSDMVFKKKQKILILKNLGFDAIIYLIFNKIRNLVFKNKH